MKLYQNIEVSFKNAINAFINYPVTMLSALLFAIVTMVRIQLDWSQQVDYNFLFNCLHLSLASMAIFGLSATVAVRSRLNTKTSLVVSYIISSVVGVLIFIVLLNFGGKALSGGTDKVITQIAASRMTAFITISFITFIYFMGEQNKEGSFPNSFFMVHKSLVISLIYGSAIMGGSAGVAGAIQALLYNDLSSKVYMYLSTISGFIAFSIFVGYFPDVIKGRVDSKRQQGEKKPKFIEILFGFIAIPIISAITFVLLAWVGKIIFTESSQSFSSIFGIITSYCISGIWLYIMVEDLDLSLVKLYRQFYPIALFVILIFGAWRLGLEVISYGLMDETYAFAVVIVAAFLIVFLIFLSKKKLYEGMVVTFCLVPLLVVMPLIGYHVLPPTLQLSELESILVEQGILMGDTLQPITRDIGGDVRVAITEKVEYLSYKEGLALPGWFDKNLNDAIVFEKMLGFEKEWSNTMNSSQRIDDTLATYLMMPSGAIKIDSYEWAIYIKDSETGLNRETSVDFEDDKGAYNLSWRQRDPYQAPVIRIAKSGDVLLEEDLRPYLETLVENARSQQSNKGIQNIESTQLAIESDQFKILILFDYLSYEVDPVNDSIGYFLSVNAVYFSEK